jgi:hypothetical protein
MAGSRKSLASVQSPVLTVPTYMSWWVMTQARLRRKLTYLEVQYSLLDKH